MGIAQKIAIFILKGMALSVISMVLYWLFWIIFDYKVFQIDGFTLNVVLLDFSFNFILAFCVYLLYKLFSTIFYRNVRSKWYFMLLASAFFFTILAIAHVLEHLTVDLFYSDYPPESFLEGHIISASVAAIIALILISNDHFNHFMNELEEKRRNEMNVLKHQLDPHFVFNNLTTLDALIEEDKDKAHSFLIKLSQTYRFFIRTVGKETVSVSEAIEFLHSYVALLGVGIPERFTVEIDPELNNCSDRIVPISLQLLVENAIKHNRHSESNPLPIKIWKEEDCVCVSNEIRPLSSEKASTWSSESACICDFFGKLANESHADSTRIGLDNLCRRCRYVIGRCCTASQSNGIFEVRVPIKKSI